MTRRVQYPTQQSESSRKETLPFSCLLCLVDRSRGGVRPPCCPLLFLLLLAFQSWLASGFLAETAAWTNSRWAKEEAGLSFIQTRLWIAAGGWCIQIPQTRTGLFSWWRPWGRGRQKEELEPSFYHEPRTQWQTWIKSWTKAGTDLFHSSDRESPPTILKCHRGTC